jgi:hypothetical protein
MNRVELSSNSETSTELENAKATELENVKACMEEVSYLF